MTIEKIETKFIIDDGFPSPKIISNSNNLYLNFRVDDENYETITLKFLNHHLYKIGYTGMKLFIIILIVFTELIRLRFI